MAEFNLVPPLVAITLAGAHLIAPRVHRLTRAAEAEVVSFAGGLAVAYVFLHLIPEIDQSHHVIGSRIYLVVLVGFMAFYGIEVAIRRRVANSDTDRDWAFVLRLALLAIYNLVLAFTLIELSPDNTLLVVLFALAMALHLTCTNIGLLDRFGKRFASSGRYVLAAAILLGFVASHLLDTSALTVDLVTASIAGFMVFRVFNEELSQIDDARFAWFVMGALSLGTLHFSIALI